MSGEEVGSHVHFTDDTEAWRGPVTHLVPQLPGLRLFPLSCTALLTSGFLQLAQEGFEAISPCQLMEPKGGGSSQGKS